MKGKILLCKFEHHPEIKRRFLECFDYDVFGDQLGLTPEVEVRFIGITSIKLLNGMK